MLAHRFRFLVVALCVLPRVATPSTTGWTDLQVRVYDTANLRSEIVEAALVTAGRALVPAAVDVHWTRCGTERTDAPSARQPSSCAQPLRAGELAVRVVRAPVPPGYRGALPLGDAMVIRGSGIGVLGTIYADRVEWLARAAGSDLASLLGQALAHELGHLLMGTSTHGLHGGLMRAQWTRDEVRRARPEDWRMAAQDVARIKGRVGRS